MSGLKEHLFCKCDEIVYEYRKPLSNEMRPYYLKSEADKVIEELKARIEEGDKEFDFADHQNERLLKENRHHKYKRCLAMAKMCCGKSTICMLGGHHDRKCFYSKWHLRWRELAEKFKPNNSTAQ